MCHFHICTGTTGLRSNGVRQMAWANYLFNGLGDKADRLTRLAPNTDAEIKEKISASTLSYTTKSTEDTFRLDTVFESFHYQAKTPISYMALLAEFLMLWLKRCIMPTLSHEVMWQMWYTQLSYWRLAKILLFVWQWWGAFRAGFGC